jgi:hydantoinase/carbamoylase family amidase
MAAPLVAARRLAMDAGRVISDLRELDRRTGGPDGARRVCWTQPWEQARAFLRERLAELPVTVDVDEAGNLWAQLTGEGDAVVVVGSHLDSVPGGGWLDGALGVFAALEVLRTAGRPAVTLRLVDWADEEGRFGRSLFGSSACAGTLDADAVRDLRDRDGVRLADAVGIDLDRAGAARDRLAGVHAYLELHIEQGPVLESRDASAAAVLGTCGVERHVVVFTGQAAHAGATPMAMRRDSFAAAAQAALAIRRIGFEHEGVCTVGGAASEPGIATAVAGRTEMLLDQRHLDPGSLAAMLAAAHAACAQAAVDHGCEVELQPVWSIPPVPFDERLIAVAREAVGTSLAIPSGPLHDASEMARVVPTVMLFAKSSPPVSHTKEEDTPEADLRVAIEAYGRAVARTVELVAAGATAAS